MKSSIPQMVWAGVAIIVLALIHVAFPTFGHVPLFHAYALGFVHHGTWPREYPYLAAVEFALPLALPLSYNAAWLLLEALGWFGVAYVLYLEGANLWLWGGAILLAGIEPAFGLAEAYPVLLVAIAFYLQSRGKIAGSGLALAAAAAIRLYPLLLLPIWLAGLRTWRERVRLAGWSLIPFVGGWIIAYLRHPGGVFSAVFWELGRPAEFESSPAAVSYLLHLLGVPMRFAMGYGSTLVLSPESAIVTLLFEVTAVGLLAYLIWQVYRGHLDIPRASVVALAGILALHKSMTPEYVLWLLPFAALVGEDTGLWLLLGALTALVFPFVRIATAPGGRPIPVAPLEMDVVVARDLVLGLLPLVALWRWRSGSRAKKA